MDRGGSEFPVLMCEQIYLLARMQMSTGNVAEKGRQHDPVVLVAPKCGYKSCTNNGEKE